MEHFWSVDNVRCLYVAVLLSGSNSEFILASFCCLQCLLTFVCAAFPKSKSWCALALFEVLTPIEVLTPNNIIQVGIFPLISFSAVLTLGIDVRGT